MWLCNQHNNSMLHFSVKNIDFLFWTMDNVFSYF